MSFLTLLSPGILNDSCCEATRMAIAQSQSMNAWFRLQGLRIDPRRLVSKLLHILNIRPGINRGIAVRAALAAQFQHT